MRAKTIAFACGMGLIAAGAIDYQATTGNPYIGRQPGGVFLQDSEFTVGTASGAASAGEVDYDTSWGLGGAAGYSFDSGFRAEAEVTYRGNDVSGFSFNGAPTFPASDADASDWAFMANGYYDFNTGTRWTPYVGGGVGLALDHIEGSAGPGFGISDTQSEFAYQGIAGVGYQLTDQLNLGVEYRYFATTDPTFNGSAGSQFASDMAAITSS
jgi:OOP family OmpA-OmpF porin